MDTACILWEKYKDKDGYGRLTYEGKSVRAHRLAYAKANGVCIHTLVGVVLHSCDNPPCINPEHLSLGTHQDNVDDMLIKGRQVHGDQKVLAVLTEQVVEQARRRHIKGCKIHGSTALAREFGVSVSTMCKAMRGETWAVSQQVTGCT